MALLGSILGARGLRKYSAPQATESGSTRRMLDRRNGGLDEQSSSAIYRCFAYQVNIRTEKVLGHYKRLTVWSDLVHLTV